MKKKIGLFTICYTNYGAVLQAYALQHYLEKQHDALVDVINFTPPERVREYRVFRKLKNINNPIYILVYFIFTILRYFQLKRRIERTLKFKTKFLNLTRCYSTFEDLKKNIPAEDIFIVGSDQVFNPNSTQLRFYYLDFVKGNNKKVAYAPSFGISKFNDIITAKISDYIKDFDYLSCRETVGADYLTKIAGRKVPVVADPVLLHSAEEWCEIAVNPNYGRKYILIYDLNGADNLVIIAKKIQQRTGLDIVCVTGNRMKIYPINKQVYDAGPAEFVGWIKNAEYVVTDSFHGTVFSMIFSKSFYTFIALEQTSSRVRSILKLSGMSHRIVTNVDIYNFDLDADLKENPIQSQGLKDLVEYSKSYIVEFLS